MAMHQHFSCQGGSKLDECVCLSVWLRHWQLKKSWRRLKRVINLVFLLHLLEMTPSRPGQRLLISLQGYGWLFFLSLSFLTFFELLWVAEALAWLVNLQPSFHSKSRCNNDAFFRLPLLGKVFLFRQFWTRCFFYIRGKLFVEKLLIWKQTQNVSPCRGEMCDQWLTINTLQTSLKEGKPFPVSCCYGAQVFFDSLKEARVDLPCFICIRVYFCSLPCQGSVRVCGRWKQFHLLYWPKLCDLSESF